MANRIPKFTKRAVDALKAGSADTVYWDGELTGFGVRVRKSGRKNYVVQTRVAGKLRWFTIGQHGPITLEQARAAALEILALAKKGIDPRDDDATRAAEPVMADLGKRFPGGLCPGPLQAQHQGGIPAIGDIVHRSRDRRDAGLGGAAQGHRRTASRSARQALPGEPEPWGSSPRCSPLPRSGAGGRTGPIPAVM